MAQNAAGDAYTTGQLDGTQAVDNLAPDMPLEQTSAVQSLRGWLVD